MPARRLQIAGVVLAGGRARRFGGDKALALLEGRPLIERSLDALRGRAEPLAVNGPAALAAAVGLPAIADPPGLAEGPLAGILAAMAWAKAMGCSRVLTVPCDTPILPRDLAARLIAAGASAPAAAARAERAHALCGLWSLELAEAVAPLAGRPRQPAVAAVLEAVGGVWVDFPDEAQFANLNTREDLERARVS